MSSIGFPHYMVIEKQVDESMSIFGSALTLHLEYPTPYIAKYRVRNIFSPEGI